MTDKGAGPLVWEAPVLLIEGNKYKVQRLGLPQIHKVARIYAAYSAFAERAAMLGAIKSPELLGTFIIDALANAFDEVVELLASVIGIDPGIPESRIQKLKEEHDRRNAQRLEHGKDELPWVAPSNEGTIRDPNVFPLGSELEVVEAIVEHQDIDAFFARLRSLMGSKALKSLGQRLNKRSTASKRDTGGQTKK